MTVSSGSQAPCFSPSTPRPWPPRFCPKEAEVLSQLVLEEHGGGSLAMMHERSVLEPGLVDSNLVACSSYASIRRKAVDWVIKVFYNLNLRDEWMVGVVTLLDRVAACRGAAASPNRKVAVKRTLSGLPRERDLTVEEQAECLAAMLCVLKLSSAEAELETIGLKELIFQIAELPRGSSTMWDLVVKSEFNLYRTLNYCVALPSSADLAGRIALDVESAARKQHKSWAGLITEEPPAPRPELTTPVSRFSLLISFLVELGLSHIQEAVYGQATPAIALALVAVHLALDRFGDSPTGGLAALEAAEKETLGAEAAGLLPPLTVALHSQWLTPASGSRVIRKWEHRAQVFTHGALPRPSQECPVRSGQAQLPLQTLERRPTATTPMRGQPKPKPSPRSAPKHTGPKAVMTTPDLKLEPTVPVVAAAEDPPMLSVELAEKPVADKTVETLAKVVSVPSVPQLDVKIVEAAPLKQDDVCDKEVQPENAAFLAEIVQLHSAKPTQQDVVSDLLLEPTLPLGSPAQEAETAAPARQVPERLLQRVPSAPVSPEPLAVKPEKANPFGQPMRSAIPAPLSVLVGRPVSRPSSTPSSPVKEEQLCAGLFGHPSLSSNSKVGPPTSKLMDSGALRPPPSSATLSFPSAAAKQPFRRHRVDGSSVVRPALPVTPPLPPAHPQVAPIEGVLPEAVTESYRAVCSVVEKRPPPGPSASLLQRSRRVEKVEVSSVSIKAQEKFAGAWEIQSVSKQGATLGEAFVAGAGSFIKLVSANGREDPLRIEGTGDRGNPFLVVDEKNGTFCLRDHQPACPGRTETLTWKHSKAEKYTIWVRTDIAQAKTKRVMNALRARKKAKSVGEDQHELAQAFNDVITGPPSKRRKLVSISSNESTAACKVAVSEANKENATQNRPVPRPQATVLVKSVDLKAPVDRGVLKTYGKRPRAMPDSPEEDEFVCY